MSAQTVQVGHIDESGYLNGFGRRGFTFPKCILELVANILDAMENVKYSAEHRPTILFKETRTHTRLIDNASGMDISAASNMFAMHRENHGRTSCRGVSGIGAKPSLSILSNKTDVEIYTHTHNGPYLKIVVPWAQIHSEGKYTNMVSITQMSDAEILVFNNERKCNKMINMDGCAIGTTIVFKNNDKLHNVIEDNFMQNSDLQNPLDRIGVVFGRENVDIFYERMGEDDIYILPLYNYFNGSQSDYYEGVNEEVIEQWNSRTNDDIRFIWYCADGTNYEVEKRGRGFATNISEVSDNLSGFKRVGKYKISTSMRYDSAIFNPEAPTEITAENIMNAYDKKYLDEKNKSDIHYLRHYKLVRNNQIIGLIAPPDISIGNARANGRAFFDIQHLQTYIAFNPVSTQNNPQDEVMGIQENKNQFNGESIPKNFTRLVRAIRELHGDRIWYYFTRKIQETKKEDDSDSDSEDDGSEDDASGDESGDKSDSESGDESESKDEGNKDNDNKEKEADIVNNNTGENGDAAGENGDAAGKNGDAASENGDAAGENNDNEDESKGEGENTGASKEETKDKKPVDVGPYRKNAVTGKELIEQLNTLLATISSDTVYTDSSIIEFYNKLSVLRVSL